MRPSTGTNLSFQSKCMGCFRAEGIVHQTESERPTSNGESLGAVDSVPESLGRLETSQPDVKAATSERCEMTIRMWVMIVLTEWAPA